MSEFRFSGERRHADGSIDFDFYRHQAHRERTTTLSAFIGVFFGKKVSRRKPSSES
jgi:extradiol dioxygenase family protein